MLIEKGGRHQYISALQFAAAVQHPDFAQLRSRSIVDFWKMERWMRQSGPIQPQRRVEHMGAVWAESGREIQASGREPARSAGRLTDRHVETGEHRYEDRTTPDRRDPAALYGEPADRGYLFLHGQMGHKEEAETFARTACPKGYQVLSIDLPGHGERRGPGRGAGSVDAAPDIRAALDWAGRRWKSISLRANSIGAYFAMLAFDAPDRALLVSPILDMEELILTMLSRAGATEGQLRERGEIAAPVRTDPVLEVPVLGAGASAPRLDLSRPYPLWGPG